MFVFFCGFFHGFQHFGVFFELGFHSDCIQQKRECSPNVDGSGFFWPGENKLHHRRARENETFFSRSQLISRSFDSGPRVACFSGQEAR